MRHHDEAFLIRSIDDSVLTIQWRWGKESICSLPCLLDGVKFNLEVVLEQLSDEDSGYRIGMAAEVKTASREQADIIWTAVEATLNESLGATQLAVTPTPWIREDVEYYQGTFLFSQAIAVDVEDWDDAIFHLRLYVRQLWNEFNQLGWIQPQEGEE